MNTEERHTSGTRLHGNGLLARIHLSTLSKKLCVQESAIRNRWCGLQSNIPAESNVALTDIQADRGWF